MQITEDDETTVSVIVTQRGATFTFRNVPLREVQQLVNKINGEYPGANISWYTETVADDSLVSEFLTNLSENLLREDTAKDLYKTYRGRAYNTSPEPESFKTFGEKYHNPNQKADCLPGRPLDLWGDGKKPVDEDCEDCLDSLGGVGR